MWMNFVPNFKNQACNVVSEKITCPYVTACIKWFFTAESTQLWEPRLHFRTSKLPFIYEDYRESVVGSAIQANRTVELGDGLRIGVLPGGCLYPCGGCTWPRIKSAPPEGCRFGHGGSMDIIRTPVRPNSNSVKFGAWVVSNYSSYVVWG